MLSAIPYDIVTSLPGTSLVSDIDLTEAHHQVSVGAEDAEKNAGICFGLFEFLLMPFGLRNTAALRLFNSYRCVKSLVGGALAFTERYALS